MNLSSILFNMKEVYHVVDPNCRDIRALDDVTIQSGEKVVLGPSSYSESTLYIWSESGDCDENVLSLDPKLVIAPSQTTTYMLTTVSPSGCITEDVVTVTVRKRDDVAREISVYPSPAGDIITVEFEIEKANSAYLEIIKADYSFKQNIEISERSTKEVLNVSNYPSGVYNIRLVVDGRPGAITYFVKL